MGTYHATKGLLYMQKQRIYQEPPFHYPLLFKEGVK